MAIPTWVIDLLNEPQEVFGRGQRRAAHRRAHISAEGYVGTSVGGAVEECAHEALVGSKQLGINTGAILELNVLRSHRIVRIDTTDFG